MKLVPIDPAVAIAEVRAVGLEPLEPYPGSNKPWSCQCTQCGSQVSPRLSSIRNGQGGCRVCGSRSRPRLDPEVAAAELRAAGFEPSEPYPGLASDRWSCRCQACGSEVRVRLEDLRAGHGCRECWVLSQRTTPLAALAAMRAVGLEPLEPFPGTAARWWCRCLTCGRDSMQRLPAIKTRGSQCPTCAARG